MAESDPVFEEPVQELPTSGSYRTRRWRRIIAMVSVPVVLVAGGAVYFVMSSGEVSTSNAYVRQDKVSVAPEVTGNIVEVAVHENQMVRAGDLLFRINPEPFRIAIQQADAAMASAEVRVTGLETELGATGVDIHGAAEDVEFYQREYGRQAELLHRGFTTRARVEQAQHDLDDARSKLADAQATQTKARAALATAPVAPGINPAILSAKAQRRKAELDLARSEVHAPVSGKVSQASSLQIGQMMFTGMPAVTLVRSDASWIEANFKETDLDRMHVGQPAELTFDAYPGLKLKGRVASIGAGTGSEFSILPAQNANGNWVKVTQRIPVRIAIEGSSSRPLIAGMSTHVTIDTRR